jgi:demethylmenaquinone methyltransferase / 2-methoxy-6-polyprenyl-1,4-benzoquinol methylase
MVADQAELPPRTRHARDLFAGLPATYDRVGAVLSFGQDPRWRRFMASRVTAPEAGRALDVATGTGAVAIELARWIAAPIVGLDQSHPMVRRGIDRVARAGLSRRIRFVLAQGERLPFPEATFDAVTFSYLLRYVESPAQTLAELARVLRPGGTMAGLEFHVPRNRAWRAGWSLYTRAVMPVVGRLLSRSWYQVGRFLGPSISSFYRRHPLDEQLTMWRAAGIADARARIMSLGGGVVIWGKKERERGSGGGR